MSTIPASQLIQVTPSVVTAGGEGVATIGLVLDNGARLPIGSVLSFADADAVQTYFGTGKQATGAGVYFEGFTGAQQTPSQILMAQYNQSAVAAWLRGGSGLTLAAVQALDGTLDVVVDGYPRNATVNLTSATSFTNAASTIQTALNGADPTEASVTASIGSTFTGTQSGTALTTTSTVGLISVGDTVAGTGIATGTTIVSQTSGTPGGNGVYVTSLAGTASSASCTGSSNVVDVTVLGSGTVAIGQYVTGSGVTSAPIVALGTGTGGVGTYVISGAQQQVASETMTLTGTPVAVTYDSIAGAFVITSGITGVASTIAFATGAIAAGLLLTSATGAVTSQGAVAAVPATFMNALVTTDNNWVAFMTDFDPDGGSGNTVKQAFAAWKNTQNNRFAYVCFDTDITPTESVPATSSLGYILANNGDSGTCLIYEPSDLNLSWFVLGIVASIDFNAVPGRLSFAYKAQAGLTASVSNPTVALNLAGNPQATDSFGNGYNFYGAYAEAGVSNVWFQRGFVTGPYEWLDSYINQIWLTSIFQSALLNLFANALSVPFNTAGSAMLESALLSPIQQGLAFGAFGPGAISNSQAQQINSQAGNTNAATAVSSQGWYLQIVPASTAVRASRGPQQINFWYLDNGTVQSISMSSVEVQA
jgi:Protein of unknown function (DUF3383)